MLLYSESIFTLLMMFSELILALPKAIHLEDRSELSEVLSEKGNLFSMGSNIASLSNKRKRLLHQNRKSVKPGVKCDGTFYRESKVDAIANKACKDSFMQTGFARPKSAISRMFMRSQKPFTGSADIFPNELLDDLTMLPITNSFFPSNRIAAFLGQRKEDYIVFANNCRTVGVVRRLSRNNFIICSRTENVPWLPEKFQTIEANRASF